MIDNDDVLPVFDSCQPENNYLKSFSLLTLAELFSCFSTSLLIHSCSREPIILTLGLLKKNNQSKTSTGIVESIFLKYGYLGTKRKQIWTNLSHWNAGSSR